MHEDDDLESLRGDPHFETLGRKLSATKLRAKRIEAALEAAKPAEELMVIGAYATALPHADRIELTEVSADVEGDTFFPELDLADWIEVSREPVEPGEHDDWPMEFVTLKRR